MVETEHNCPNCGGLIANGSECSHCVEADLVFAETGESLSEVLDRSQTTVVSIGAMLLDEESGERYPLSQSVSKIGRDRANNISLPNDSYISRHHAWLLFIKGNYFVEDLGSTNGTLLNGEVLSERKQIFPGDRIKFGRTELIFEIN